MINNVVLVGRLTRDPELRTTGSGISVATFTLAVDRQFTNASGQREADFISCVIWRKAAENFCNFTSKGSLVGIQGRIQTRNYDNKDGQRVYVTEVLVDNFSLLESRRERESRQQNSGFGGGSGYANNAFGSSAQSNGPANAGFNEDNKKDAGGDTNTNPFDSSDDAINVSNDDLPF
ncbi:single-stranded DNA-binding protein [Lactobacillus delbrueckii subsp. bulgaricus]|uniref:single-stranded DNA-binding protein n=1 Tax=Lactobacillus delbrueckii TaxID=1584 RepID=UPI001E59BC81|nr:single-stranded DNA-binding protein [Lactobacillus delbrueckii]MCD5467157.1 single-stranded DNA-binding protein [Lactobacillus delbrueckii subsp. bulgaricus]MCD5482791.1 single-stranded DNA-binding protein [Lactobacillus delbrueckii subsp. bulgaricus]